MSTVSQLRGILERDERKLRYLRESSSPKSAYMRTKARIANVADALAREERRLLDAEARL